jgi:hypothetical protein
VAEKSSVEELSSLAGLEILIAVRNLQPGLIALFSLFAHPVRCLLSSWLSTRWCSINRGLEAIGAPGYMQPGHRGAGKRVSWEIAAKDGEDLHYCSARGGDGHPAEEPEGF